VETCVGGARVIGDINDPNSEVRRLMTQHQDDIKVLKPNEGTKPHVFYIGMNERFTQHIEGQPAIYDPQGEKA
jgi:tetrathionate reductase subunit B